jgi:hypothetical protein
MAFGTARIRSPQMDALLDLGGDVVAAQGEDVVLGLNLGAYLALAKAASTFSVNAERPTWVSTNSRVARVMAT